MTESRGSSPRSTGEEPGTGARSLPAADGSRLLSYLDQDFNIKLTSVELVSGGVDRVAHNFRGRSPTGRYAIKWSSGGSVAGLLVPSALAARGVHAVAAPLPTRDGHLWSEREGRRLSVTPWVGERPGLDGGLDAVQWCTFGQLLAETHALPITKDLADVLPKADHWKDLASLRRVDTMLHSTPPPDAIAIEIRQLWLDHADLIAEASARVEQLAPAVVPNTVCHTDPHLGNVLVTPGRMWLIDWDDAALSIPEHDLMFVLGGAYGDEHIGDRERAWFFEGYGTVAINPTHLAYWRGSRGLCDIAFLAEETFQSTNADETWRTRALRMTAANLSSTGLIARALH